MQRGDLKSDLPHDLCLLVHFVLRLELGLIQTYMTQKPVLRVEGGRIDSRSRKAFEGYVQLDVLFLLKFGRSSASLWRYVHRKEMGSPPRPNKVTAYQMHSGSPETPIKAPKTSRVLYQPREVLYEPSWRRASKII